jgi:hypothetical protein
MRDRFGLIFVLLVVCGTLCILGSLAFLGLLFNSHAVAMSVASRGGAPMSAYVVNFLFFVLLPALISFFAGVWMVKTGIRIGQTTTPEPPYKK